MQHDAVLRQRCEQLLRAGWSVTHVAEITGVGVRTIRRWAPMVSRPKWITGRDGKVYPVRTGSTRQWRDIRRVVLARDLLECQVRGPKCTRIATTVDHVVRVRDGGTDALSNLRACCAPCNRWRESAAGWIT